MAGGGRASFPVASPGRAGRQGCAPQVLRGRSCPPGHHANFLAEGRGPERALPVGGRRSDLQPSPQAGRRHCRTCCCKQQTLRVAPTGVPFGPRLVAARGGTPTGPAALERFPPRLAPRRGLAAALRWASVEEAAGVLSCSASWPATGNPSTTRQAATPPRGSVAVLGSVAGGITAGSGAALAPAWLGNGTAECSKVGNPRSTRWAGLLPATGRLMAGGRPCVCHPPLVVQPCGHPGRPMPGLAGGQTQTGGSIRRERGEP